MPTNLMIELSKEIGHLTHKYTAKGFDEEMMCSAYAAEIIYLITGSGKHRDTNLLNLIDGIKSSYQKMKYLYPEEKNGNT